MRNKGSLKYIFLTRLSFTNYTSYYYSQFTPLFDMCFKKKLQFHFPSSMLYIISTFVHFLDIPFLATGTWKCAANDLLAVTWKTIEIVHYTHGISTACMFLASMVCYNFVAHNKRSDAVSIRVGMR